MQEENPTERNKMISERPNRPMAASAGRQSTKRLLLEHAERLRREAHQLEALAYQTESIHGEAEEILYRLLSGEVLRR